LIDVPKVNTLLNEIDGFANLITAHTEKIRAEVNRGTVVSTSDALRSALVGGGVVQLQADTAFTGPFAYTPTPAFVFGQGGNKAARSGGPVFDFPPGVKGGTLSNVDLQVSASEIVVMVGRNTTEQTPDNLPVDVLLEKIFIVGHRGKRGIEFNGSGLIQDCYIADLYDPEKIENQAIWIANTVGNVTIERCHLEASSQSIMAGGDTDRMPGGPVRNLTIRECILTKPIADWRPIGVPVKTLLELKDGVGVMVENCELFNCWKAGQDGYAIVLTPRRGGVVRDVTLKDLHVYNVGAIANILGFDDPYPDLPRTQVTFVGGDYQTNCKELGGRGCFALITNGPDEVRILNLRCKNDGTSFVLVGDGDPVGLLEIRGCTFNYGTYGIFVNGHPDGDNSLGLVKTMIVEGNTISGAKAAFKARWPNNTYV
jgi:hypothetical protein